ncbi:EAL domain-containing protein [Modestobacter sp. I12A-02628]|uniref:EAL domain-containing protein n=1 Tax=Goekera deserti TaxID=2497753 RepID=A0A7K3WJC9_9ACTN|nr:EAL domain-containing protein [Goekera deserti]MPQ99982.1 EAL domain-containing protein [Goekera deserti]NDI49761.1 EAL domain-containing protein [Goekera deserti]NEL56611.1 EAL domain-containing protein [Goekera deserti]
MASSSTGADAPVRTAAGRAALTVLGTLLVIGVEFLLLYGVYHRAAPVETQRVVVARLAGDLTGTAGGPPVTDLVTRAADDLSDAGLDGDDVDRLRAAAAGTPAEARAAADALGERLAEHSRSLDVQAAAVYAAMLVVASVGWMLWFRRLVARHRALQAEVTEQQARAASEGRLASLVRTSSDAIVVLTAEGIVQYASDSAEAVFGVPAAVLQDSVLLDHVLPAHRSAIIAQLASPREGETALQLEFPQPDGRVRHVEGVLSNLLADPGVQGLVITARDVSARVALEEQLTHQALHDPLTGLSNRRLFLDRLAHSLRRRGSHTNGLTVLFCDLDDFAFVNDRFGQDTGDLLLAEVGRRLVAVAREGDTVARLGGDEFALLLEDIAEPEAQAIAARVHARLTGPVHVGDRTIDLALSIGIAHAPDTGITAQDLVRNADVAVHVAKDGGKHGTATYEPALHSVALERLQLRADLQRALDVGQLELYFQPTVDLAASRIASFEALVRWHHPVRGMVPPVEFIPLAEQYELIVPLGTWVLQEACRAGAALQRPGERPVSMAVNVSVQQLTRPDFADLVAGAVAAAGFDTRSLVLEITETAMLADAAVVAPVLAALRDTGVRIAIDDFGTGYSSLSYLRDLPVDVLKVDKSFVDHVVGDEQGASLAEAIIAMSRSLRLSTVAEGVEHAGQAAWLTAAGCDYGQGYLWSRPVPLARAHALLADPAAATAPTGTSPTGPRPTAALVPATYPGP